jgi:general secretion pathway protein L
MQPLLRELRATLKSYTAKTHRVVERILLCGGTSSLKGLDAQLSRDLGVPVQRLELPADVREAAGMAAPRAAQAWALNLRGAAAPARAPRFNLRRNEFAFKSDFDVVREKLPTLITFVALLLVLLVASGVVRTTVLERRDKQLDAMLCDVTQRVLGKCEKDYDIALSRLQGTDTPASGIPKRSAVTLLAELVSRIPPELPVTMDQLVLDFERITVRCEAANSKQVDELVTALKGYPCFKEIKEGKVEKNKDGTKVSFRLDIQVECPTDAAPQG